MKNTHLWALLLAVALVLTLAGCSADNPNVEPPLENTATTVPAEDPMDNLRAHAAEHGYSEFVQFMEDELNDAEKNIIIQHMSHSYLGFNTLNYDEMLGDGVWLYNDGVYHILQDDLHKVRWYHNMEEQSAFECTNLCKFAVVDPEQVAYMLIQYEHEGNYLVKITKDATSNVEYTSAYTAMGFDNFWNLLVHTDNQALKEFAEVVLADEDAGVPDEFLEALYTSEKNYDKLEDYAGHLTGEEFEQAQTAFSSGNCDDPIRTYLYDVEYRDFVFDTMPDGYLDLTYTFYYKNGIYAIDKYQDVVWSHNIVEDPEPRNLERDRYYTVADPIHDAYMLISDRDGYEFVRIVPTANAEVVKEETHPVYTYNGLSRLFYPIHDAAQAELEAFNENHLLTEDLVWHLDNNAEDLQELYWYAERINDDKERERAIDRFEERDIEPAITYIDMDDTYQRSIFSYEDGVLTIKAGGMIENVWTQNMIGDPRPLAYMYDRVYEIANENIEALFYYCGEGGANILAFKP